MELHQPRHGDGKLMATGSGTGTQAAAAQATTAQTIVDNAQTSLDDAAAATFTEAELLLFLNEGIREYSQHLPLVSTDTITAVASTRSYSLPWDTINVLAVEYPTGEDPAIYLKQMKRKRPSFYNEQYYDFLQRHDLTTAPTLLLSFDPTADETITVTYQHAHNHALALSDNCTVPREHHHILVQYIMFAAARQLQANEEAAPTSSSSLLMNQLASNTRRYELSYLNAINRVLFQRRGQSDTSTSWEMDRFGRIY